MKTRLFSLQSALALGLTAGFMSVLPAWAAESATLDGGQEQGRASADLNKITPIKVTVESPAASSDTTLSNAELLAQEAAVLEQLKTIGNGSGAFSLEVSVEEPNSTASKIAEPESSKGHLAVVSTKRLTPKSEIIKAVGNEAPKKLDPSTPNDDGTSKLTALESQKKVLEKELRGRDQSLRDLRTKNGSLQAELNQTTATVADLTQELEELRSQLMIAETEVERLSAVVEKTNRDRLARFTSSSQPQKPVTQAVSTNTGRTAKSSKSTAEAQPASEADMPIATIIVEKANLRTGPGENNSPLMTVSRGTRLAVETRVGSWYRVIAPTGMRAWVASSVVAFGPSNGTSPSRTIKVKGFDNSSSANTNEVELVSHVEG